MLTVCKTLYNDGKLIVSHSITVSQYHSIVFHSITAVPFEKCPPPKKKKKKKKKKINK